MLLLPLLALPSLHCGKLLPAVGAGGEVTLLTDLPSGHPAEEALRTCLTREVEMVFPEPAFTVESVQASQLGRRRHHRNLILMADLSRTGTFTQEVEKLIGERLVGEMRAGRRTYIVYADVWATGQTLMVLAAPDAGVLAKAIEAQADEIFTSFSRRVIRQTAALLYVTGEQKEMSRYLRGTYGWSLRIPKGFRISEDAEARVVRFWMPEGGTRLLFVHWQDGVRRLPEVEACLDLRGRIVWNYDQDVILPERSRSERVSFLGGRALQLAGVWQNERDTKGGPFRTYCFMKGDRFYMIDLLAFDPEGSKVNLMRQLEAMAITFVHEDD